ncbi:MAG: hypothetical protein ISS72_05430 [Candidatus Brocadiae bacterium]|nr:hypothetical protein [Candidatus Brocadiia bacterium]
MSCGVLSIAIVLIAASAVAAPWRDGFDAKTLSQRWTWHVPAKGPTVSLGSRAGWLRLTVPQTRVGFNHWGREPRAAFLRTPAPDGDWHLSARVAMADWKPDSNLHLALVVGFSNERVLAWGPFLSKQLYPDSTRPTLWAEPTGRGAYIRTAVEARDVEIQIARRVDTYHLRHRTPGQAKWTEAGCWYGGGLRPQFVGLMGKSFGPNPAGALDVDYVELTPQRAPTAPVSAKATVRLGSPSTTRLPGLQRGFFLEFLGHCIFQGIWDERLHNRKFIGPNTSTGVVWKWEPTGRAKGYTADTAVPYAEPQSQRIDRGAGEGGIAQNGLELQKGRAYATRIVVRAKGTTDAVTVALRDARGTLARHTFRLRGTGWQTLSCPLAPSHGTSDGSFAITAKGPGCLWVGAASLMPADNVQGYRRDVLEVTRMAKPPTFRWPGGNMASGYNWRDGIGPQDRRPTRWDRAWKAWVYNDMGTDEYIAYCRLLGAEPCICVNAGEGTAAEAAAWVEYVNGAADTPMGKLRAANGHPEPYGVKYWGVGNELWGTWQLGHVGPEHYGLRAVEFARAMRKVDPSIVLIASGVFDDTFGDWNRRALRICGSAMDMLSVHDYTGYDTRQCTDAVWAKVVGAPVRIERSLRNTVQIAEQAAGKRLPLTFDEWNTTPSHIRGGHCLADGLYAAGVFHAMQRCGSDVPIGNLALLANVIGSVRTNPAQVVQTPLHLAFRLYAQHSGPWDVPAAATADAFRGLPSLDVAATLSDDRRTLHLTAINRHPRRAVAVAWKLGDLKPRGEAVVTTLAGPELWARNTFEGPTTVTLATERHPWAAVAGRPLPAASVTGISVPLE